jgi:hypothetical protein
MAPWPQYADQQYGFTVSYPPGFTFQPQHGDPSSGMLMTYRVVANEYLQTYPPGQIELGVYVRDAPTVGDWINKHSGPASSSDPLRYWAPPSNTLLTTVAGKDGLSFDWIPDTGSPTIHAVAVFLSTSVLLVEWWSTDSSYTKTIESDYALLLERLTV